MNRVLRRPMFRIGGSAGSGITSGLDRKGYKDGTDEYDRALKTTERYMRDIDKFKGEESRFTPSGLPGFLTQFGLNLLATPPAGNIFQTAAIAAKEPFQTFQAAQLADRERRADSAEDIFGTALASEYDLTAKAMKSSDDRKTPEVEAELIRNAQTNIFDARKILENPDSSAEEKTAAEQKIKINQNVLLKEIGVPAEYSAIISSEELFNSYKTSYVESENQRRINEYKKENPNATPEDISANVTLLIEDSPEAADFTIAKLREKYYFASGGRVGYKLGSPDPMMESVVEQKQATGEVQELSYTELRARLPQEISNDIVQLLANSKQALLDFANIQTPEDIASFNQQYDVNLTLPQGA